MNTISSNIFWIGTVLLPQMASEAVGSRPNTSVEFAVVTEVAAI